MSRRRTTDTRYITDAEYAAIYAAAPPRLQVIMDLLYLNPQTLAGHTNEAMTDRYIRLRETPQADGPKMERILDTR